MLRVFFLVMLFMLSKQRVHSQTMPKDTCYTNPKPVACFDALRYSSKYWIQDSLTRTGFRDLFANEYLANCSTCFRGRKWADVSTYFGKPNFVFEGGKYLKEGETLYRYYVHYEGDIKDFKDIGNRYFDIIIYNGIIVYTGLDEIDG